MSERYELSHTVVAFNGDVVRVFECQDCFHHQAVLETGIPIHDEMHDAGRISGEEDRPYKGVT